MSLKACRSNSCPNGPVETHDVMLSTKRRQSTDFIATTSQDFSVKRRYSETKRWSRVRRDSPRPDELFSSVLPRYISSDGIDEGSTSAYSLPRYLNSYLRRHPEEQNSPNNMGIPKPPMLSYKIRQMLQRCEDADLGTNIDSVVGLLEIPKSQEHSIGDVELYNHFVYFFTLPIEDFVLKQMIRMYILENYVEGLLTGPKFEFLDRIVGTASFPLETMWLGKAVREGEITGKEHELGMGALGESCCDVCCETRFLTLRKCCNYNICSECIAFYIASQIVDIPDNFTVECPNCQKFLAVTEIRFRLKYSLFPEALGFFEQRLEEKSVDENSYFCANCAAILQASRGKRNTFKAKNRKECSRCGFLTCSSCKSPWHNGMTCRQFRDGEISMRRWAEGDSNVRQATKCPGCRRWYQKIDGCDHMSCRRCNTEFCYSCGCKYRSFLLMGSHSNRLSVFGCKNNFLKGHPIMRKTVRGSILCGAVAVTPVVAPIAAVGGCGVLIVWAGSKVTRRIRRR